MRYRAAPRGLRARVVHLLTGLEAAAKATPDCIYSLKAAANLGPGGVTYTNARIGFR